jgi:hypothetical protein
MIRFSFALTAAAALVGGCTLLGGPDYYIAANYYATTAVGSGGGAATGGGSGGAAAVTSSGEVVAASSGSGAFQCDKSLCQYPKDTSCGDVVCIAESKCATVLKPTGSPCSDPEHPYCDGSGACVACTPMNPCDEASTTPFCSEKLTCVACLEDAHCKDNGAYLYCAKPVGACVQCTSDAACAKDGLVCQDFTCKTPACKNKTKDGSESDVDCGGTCAPCGLGKACVMGADCTTGQCDTGTKSCVCTDQGQCAAGQYCDVGKKTCVNVKSGGSGCGNGYECESNNCSKGVTCWFSDCCQ